MYPDSETFLRNSLRNTLLTLIVLAGFSQSSALSGQEASPFPSLQGWTLTVDSMVYTPDNLWNIIDGAADAYLLYGFVDLHTGEYMNRDSVDVRAELYRHSSAANAFGIYSQERKPEYHFIEVGTEGYIEDGVLDFLCGTYYVKLTSHTMGPKGLDALRTVAEALVAHLHQEEGFPPQLALLPREGKTKRSESYIADSYLGYSYFRSAFVAQYDSGGKVQLFVMNFGSPFAARTALKRYSETLKSPDMKIEDGTFTLADPNNGTVGMLLKGQFLCGVVNCEKATKREGYLESLEKTISNR
jgi:hypothetical protein